MSLFMMIPVDGDMNLLPKLEGNVMYYAMSDADK
jgi:hypothetical protein